MLFSQQDDIDATTDAFTVPSNKPNLDRERRILSALIGQYDFLQIHGLQTSSTIADDDGLSGIPASTYLTA